MRNERRRLLAYEVRRLVRIGRSQRHIGKALGINRKTVRRLLKELEQRGELGENALEREIGSPRTPKPSMLDPHEAQIRDWLKEYPDLTALRCLEKLGDVGFTGGYTIVREYVKELRRELAPPQPKATPIETAPGQRAEFDWSPYELVKGVKVQLWNAQLRWSRAPSLAAWTDTKQLTTFRSLVLAFECWQGVPLECLTDTMPGVVDGWECDEPILNVRFVDLAAHYGFTALVAPRGCPQWKAIAERLFLYHEKNLLNGRTIRSLAEYIELLAWWQREKALGKDHPETRRPVREMLEIERAHLQPLPAIPYDTRDVVVRVVDDYQRAQYETNHYPVPAPVGSRVYVCAGPERVEICDPQARRLAEHQRLPSGGRVKIDPPHVRRVRYDVDELTERLARWGDTAADFARGVRETRRYAGPELVRLLQLQVDWSVDDLVEAMRHAMAYGCFEVGKVLRVLELRYTPRRFEDQIGDVTRQRIQESMRANPVSTRDLASYEALRHGDQREEPHNEDDSHTQDQPADSP